MKDLPSKHVAIALPGAWHWNRTSGILKYARERGNWIFHTVPEIDWHWTNWLAQWQGDGAMVYLCNPKEVAFVRKLKMPIVNFSGIAEKPGLPSVSADPRQVGQLAAEHLINRSLRRFAFYGTAGVWYSDQRRQGFVSRLKEAGYHCAVYEVAPKSPPAQRWLTEQNQLDAWVKSLQRPVGIMASHDPRAMVIESTCHRLGLQVPDDVAVIGVNNVPQCDLCNPPLTSVDMDEARQGYEGAVLLDRQMNGQSVPSERILISCSFVVTRRSTDMLAIEDPDIATAARFIRDHVHEPFGLERLVQETAVCRTKLHEGFKHWLNCSPYQYINRVRIDRAKQLLAAPGKVKLSAVMRECGFRSRYRFRLVFQRLESITPAEYRKQQLQKLANR